MKRKLRVNEIKQEAKKQNELYNWCLEQAAARYIGTMTKEQFDSLQSLDFPWEYYENELNNLGFHWYKNNPEGIRYKDIK